MKSLFYERPKKREFRYKPRFYEQDGGVKDENGNINLDKFGDRIHHKWSEKRSRRREQAMPWRTIVFLMMVIFILIYLSYKLLLF